MIDLAQPLNVIAVHLINPRAEKVNALYIGEELESLITTLGGKIVDRLVQNLAKPDPTTYIGKGKVTELVRLVSEKNIDVVILNAMAKPSQVHELKKALQEVNPKIDVWDRVDLILHIFDKHAKTTEAKLQIELARMRYMGPRIYGMGYVLSRQGGGIGTLGVGETNTELMKRHWRSEMKRVNDQLEKLSKSKEDQLARRKKSGFMTVSIVGYTNAGKSSLFKALSGKDAYIENELFATLDSSVGKFYSPGLRHEVLVTDTIGFIRSLPPRLIKAFNSTLIESLQADLLLHVIDASDPEAVYKIGVVNEILGSLGKKGDEALYVLNKIDLVPSSEQKKMRERFAEYNPIFVSVKNREGIATLQQAIESRLLRVSEERGISNKRENTL